jgi:hypothetical protein
MFLKVETAALKYFGVLIKEMFLKVEIIALK